MAGADRPVGSAFRPDGYDDEDNEADDFAEAGIISRNYAGGRYQPVNSAAPGGVGVGGGGGYRGGNYVAGVGGRRPQQLRDDGDDRYANLVFDKHAAAEGGAGLGRDVNDDGDDEDDDEDDEDDKPPSSGWVENILFVVCFYVVAVAYYTHANTAWDTEEAFYFVSTAITTVGYGDYGPRTPRDRVATIILVAVGIISVYGTISNAMNQFMESVNKRIKEKQRAADPQRAIPEDDKDVENALLLKKLSFTGIIVGVLLFGALVMMYLQGWPFYLAMYWAFQTVTTVGFGDCALTSAWSRLFAGFYALFSVGVVSACFAGLSGAKAEAKAECGFRMLLRQELNVDMIDKLDQDGSGVDKCEFVVGMLVQMGAVNERECSALMRRFAELDEDNSGRLDADDLEALKQRIRSRSRSKSRSKSRGKS